jgi:hypothetical protein
VREAVGGSRPIPRSDTAATPNRIIVTAPISPKKTRWRSTSNLTAGFFLRSIIVVFVLPLGQQHSIIWIAVVTPTPKLQVEQPRRSAAHDERSTGGQTYNYKCRRFRNSRKNFTSGIASPSEPGADIIKPAVYPFRCREWDLATARPACASNSPDDAVRRVGLVAASADSVRAEGHTICRLMPVARQQETVGMVRSVPGGNILMWRRFGKCGEITPQICQARNCEP